MKKIEHIGVAVKDLEDANKVFKKLLGNAHYKIEEVDREMVRTSFFTLGESKIELLEATSKNSTVNKFLSKRGPGFHHLAISVNDIRSEMKRLISEGFELLSTEPMRGADNKLVCFIHPKSTLGILVELCQDAGHSE